MQIRQAILLIGMMMLVCTAGAAGAAKERAVLAPIQFVDQQGRAYELAPSHSNTLIYFYRGDW